MQESLPWRRLRGALVLLRPQRLLERLVQAKVRPRVLAQAQPWPMAGSVPVWWTGGARPQPQPMNWSMNWWRRERAPAGFRGRTGLPVWARLKGLGRAVLRVPVSPPAGG